MTRVAKTHLNELHEKFYLVPSYTKLSLPKNINYLSRQNSTLNVKQILIKVVRQVHITKFEPNVKTDN